MRAVPAAEPSRNLEISRRSIAVSRGEGLLSLFARTTQRLPELLVIGGPLRRRVVVLREPPQPHTHDLRRACVIQFADVLDEEGEAIATGQYCIVGERERERREVEVETVVCNRRGG